MVKLKIQKIILFLLFSVTCQLCALARNSFAQDKIIAIVNKDIITQKDLNDFINFMRVQLSTEYKGRELESKIQSIKLDLLDKLIEDHLIVQEAKKSGMRINPERIKGRINDIKKHFGMEGEFHVSLAKQGMVQADLEKKINEQMLMYNIIELKIRSKIKVKPLEVTGFYQENIKQFVIPEERELESITTDNESLAYEIYNKLKGGMGLQDAAKEYSLSVNKFKCARDGRLRKDIEDNVFKLDVGQISSPIRIDYSFYIFRLDSIAPPRQQTLPEVQDEIQTMLFNMRMEQALAKWLDELKENSYIEILKN